MWLSGGPPDPSSAVRLRHFAERVRRRIEPFAKRSKYRTVRLELRWQSWVVFVHVNLPS
jgi:hypothetical protein